MKLLLIVAAFLMVAGCSKSDDCCTNSSTIRTERRKDVVCGMWVEKTDKAIKAEWDNADYYFCAEECKQAFVANPMKHLKTPTKCSCKAHGRLDCKCDHCAGKREPCDCLND